MGKYLSKWRNHEGKAKPEAPIAKPQETEAQRELREWNSFLSLIRPLQK